MRWIRTPAIPPFRPRCCGTMRRACANTRRCPRTPSRTVARCTRPSTRSRTRLLERSARPRQRDGPRGCGRHHRVVGRPARHAAAPALPARHGDRRRVRAGHRQAERQPALERMLRVAALASDEHVRRYRARVRRSKAAPSPSRRASRRSGAARRSAGRAGARRAGAPARRRRRTPHVPVVTSMRVPSSIPGRHDRAKTEWDAILLERPRGDDPAPVWNVRFLVEAKASADAATTDLPRLLRGLNCSRRPTRTRSMRSRRTRHGARARRAARTDDR